jgi:hypothetical protein
MQTHFTIATFYQSNNFDLNLIATSTLVFDSLNRCVVHPAMASFQNNTNRRFIVVIIVLVCIANNQKAQTWRNRPQAQHSATNTAQLIVHKSTRVNIDVTKFSNDVGNLIDRRTKSVKRSHFARMKFGHRLFHAVVPEWKDQYIDYKKLKGIIGETATDALSLAKAYDTVLRLTSVVVDENVHLLQLASEQTFFDQLEEEVARAEAFYRQRLIEAVQNFYLLVQV